MLCRTGYRRLRLTRSTSPKRLRFASTLMAGWDLACMNADTAGGAALAGMVIGMAIMVAGVISTAAVVADAICMAAVAEVGATEVAAVEATGVFVIGAAATDKTIVIK